MRIKLAIVSCFMFCTGIATKAQDWKYTVVGFEQILSFNNIKVPIYKSIPRYSSFLNLEIQFHRNYGKWFGFYTGVTLKNIGLILKDTRPNSNIKYKIRTYHLGIPVVLKIGNLNKRSFMYGGFELELATSFKSKAIANRKKHLYHEWFSNEVNPFQPSVLIGFQWSKRVSFKFKYYLDNYLTSRSILAGNKKNQQYYFSITRIFNKTKKTYKVSQPRIEQAYYY